jgi:O-antigen/teichoic acid export membrane protein
MLPINESPTLNAPRPFTSRAQLIGLALRPTVAARQTVSLFVCQVLGIILGFGINLINTRILGPGDYGLYAATFAINDFVLLFLDFGFFASGARVLALRSGEPEQQRRLVAALIVIAVALACCGALALFSLSFFATQVLNAPVGPMLRWFALLFGLCTSQTLVEAACRGTGRIAALSLYNVTCRAFCLLLLGVGVAARVYSLPWAIATTLLGYFGASVHVLYGLRPRFENLSSAVKELWGDLKFYGFHAYTGDLVCTASSRADSLILSRFVNTTAVGYYRLAGLIISPMAMFSRSLSTTMFRRFTDAPRISARVLWANTAWLILCLLGVGLIGKPIVHLTFGPKYDPVCDLLLLVALSSVFVGLALALNKFLAAQGQGRYQRTVALTMAVSSLVLDFSLIPHFGMMGACYAGVLSNLVYLLLTAYYYRVTVRSML